MFDYRWDNSGSDTLSKFYINRVLESHGCLSVPLRYEEENVSRHMGVAGPQG